MTEERKATIELSATTETVVQTIFDLALINARKRLATIDTTESEDNVEFDRAARTALSLVRSRDRSRCARRPQTQGNNRA